ncbi:RNA polymerase Rpb8-domain-containing protein [Chytriomyces cf. hyalinus JEL632]|nr:RNA polymerase Rpb8-domain-containing protein [Chytriomyces cf. hyalinus JEL632]
MDSARIVLPSEWKSQFFVPLPAANGSAAESISRSSKIPVLDSEQTESSYLSMALLNIVFTDIFEVGDVNRGGKKFDRVSRLNATSEAADTEIILDINTEIYPIKISDKFTLTLATSLSLDAVAAAASASTASKKETWRDTSSGKSLADEYEYVMYGKVYKYDESGGKNLATVYISFGGLLLVVSGEPIDLLVGQEVYLLMRKNS